MKETKNSYNPEEEAFKHDAFSTLDLVQESLSDPQKTSTNDDILKLMFSKSEVFGINKERISVVRRVYGTNKLTTKVAKGLFKTDEDITALSNEIEEVVTAVIDGNVHNWAESKNLLFLKNEAKSGKEGEGNLEPYYRSNDYKASATCKLTGEYDKILIVPMRLYKDKSIGVFIIGGTQKQQCFEEPFSRVIDSLSNRVALFMRDIDSQHRSKIQYALNSALSHNKSPIRKDVIQCCVDHLTLELQAYYRQRANNKKDILGDIEAGKRLLTKGNIDEVDYISQSLFPIPTQPWFSANELDIIVRSPQYFEQFYWVYGEGKIKVTGQKGDQGEKLDLQTLRTLAGSKLNESGYGFEMPTSLIEVFHNKRPLILNNSKECAAYFNEQANKANLVPRSCAIFPMKIPGGNVIGYFIFKNYIEKRAYKAEEVLLDGISNKVAELFVKIRHQDRDYNLVKFREVFHKKSQAYKGREYYVKKLTESLKSVYGAETKYCLIFRNKLTGDVPDLNTVNDDLQISNSFFNELRDETGRQKFVDLARTFIMSRDNDNANYVKDFIKGQPNLNYLKVDQEGENKPDQLFKRSAIFPLHRVPGETINFPIEKSPEDIKENVNVGCLIVKDIHLGKSDLKFLDSLSDQLSLKIKLLDDRDRENQLHSFSKAIRENKNLTIDSLLELIREFTKRVMYTDNMFVALIDEEKTNDKGFPAINFPLYYEHDTPQPETKLKIENNRFFDPSSTEKGRVEAILGSGKSIYINNLQDSKSWYEADDREERAGNYFSSFIGTPIWRKNKVVGVIAAYHPDKEYVYEKADLNFLVELADKASGLLRELQLEDFIRNNTALKEANRKLQEANQAIQLEERTSRLLTIRKIEKKFNTDLRDIKDSVLFVLEELQAHASNSNWSPNKETVLDMLKQSAKYSEQLINDIKSMKKSEVETYEISNAYFSVRRSIEIELSEVDLNHIIFRDKTKSNDKVKSDIFVDSYDLESVLHLILGLYIGLAKEVAGDSFCTYKVQPQEGYIEILFNASFGVESISDINQEINIKRAKQISSNMNNGTLTIKVDDGKLKSVLKIPKKPKKNNHYIYIERQIHVQRVVKFLKRKGVYPILISNSEEIDGSEPFVLYSEPSFKDLSDFKSNENFKKLYLLINDESEEVEIIKDLTVYLNKEKISDEKYLELLIEVF